MKKTTYEKLSVRDLVEIKWSQHKAKQKLVRFLVLA